MAQKNIKKIVFGFILICIAGFLLISAFYFMKVKPELASREIKNQQKLTASKQKIEERAQEIKKVQQQDEGSINMSSLIKESEAVYGAEEKNRKEGVLWVDHQSSNLVVTLGALNGILPGRTLSVYNGEQKIGQVMVDASFDVISYVHPDSSTDLTQNDYYRVVIE